LPAGVVDNGEKFVSGVIGTAEQFIAGIVDTVDKHSFAIISANFCKKVETILMGYSGAWETLIHEKKLKSKISCQISLKFLFYTALLLNTFNLLPAGRKSTENTGMGHE
jgi:hypothetical protein